jgi:hypothetical protein
MTAEIRLGTSAFSANGRSGAFCPKGMKTADYRRHPVRYVRIVELSSTSALDWTVMPKGRVMAMKKQSKSARKKKIKLQTKSSTTKAPKPRAIPMKFNVLNFVLGSSIAKSRGVSSAKATNE